MNSTDKFSYVCGEVTFASRKCALTANIKKMSIPCILVVKYVTRTRNGHHTCVALPVHQKSVHG